MPRVKAHSPRITELALAADNGILISIAALKAAGMPQELAAQIILQCHGLRCPMILRAGGRPITNQKMSPKPGVNLTKTSNHGFLKAVIAVDHALTKIEKNSEGVYQVIGHHKNDAANLLKPPTDVDYQHRIPHTVTFDDILRELDVNGDLEVSSFDEKTGQLIFKYREGHGPSTYKRNFVLQLHQGHDKVRFYSRAWDSPTRHENWKNETQVVKKPEALSAIPDVLYTKIFHQSFTLYQSDAPLSSSEKHFSSAQLSKVKVFANKSRTLGEFLSNVPKSHPQFRKLSDSGDMAEALSHLSDEQASTLHRQSPLSLSTTGDWDIMAIFYKPSLQKKYREVFNTFNKRNGCEQRQRLVDTSTEYLKELMTLNKEKQGHLEKKLVQNPDIISIEEMQEWTLFDSFIRQLDEDSITVEKLVSDFLIDRAGCISAYEFIFMQTLNYAHSCERNKYYGEVKYYHGLQQALQQGLQEIEHLLATKTTLPKDQEVLAIGREAIKYYCDLQEKEFDSLPNEAVIKDIEEHLSKHLLLAYKEEKKDYIIPHPQFDHNIRYPFQHGADMHNPYGSNLNGAWLMFTADGEVLYGKTEQQLVNVLLLGNFLEENITEVNHGANMKFWHKVIAKQIDLEQLDHIPFETLEEYIYYKFETENQADIPFRILIHYKNSCPEVNEKSSEHRKALHQWFDPWINAVSTENMSIWQDFVKQHVEGDIADVPNQRLEHHILFTLYGEENIDESIIATYITRKSDQDETAQVPKKIMTIYREAILERRNALQTDIKVLLSPDNNEDGAKNISLGLIEEYINYQFNLGEERDIGEELLSLYIAKKTEEGTAQNRISKKITQLFETIITELKQTFKQFTDASKTAQIPLLTLERYIHYQSLLSMESAIDAQILSLYLEKKTTKDGRESIAKTIIDLISKDLSELELDISQWKTSLSTHDTESSCSEQLLARFPVETPSNACLEKYFSYALLLDKDDSIDNAVLDFYISRKSELNENDSIPASILQLHQQRTERQFKI